MSRKLACIIGWPIAQSLSPVIHTAAFEALELDWTYVPLAVRPPAIAEGVELLRVLGVDGANVTIPHKVAIMDLLDDVAGDASSYGAVNTVVRDGDRLVGHNTDGEGFLRALRELRPDPDGRALVLGGGGAARAVAGALAVELGARAVTVAARRPEQAEEVARAVGCDHASWGQPVAADIVVNATSAREGLPLDAILGGHTAAVIDLIYPLPATELIARARKQGIPAQDGLPMLVHQAALSFELWTGRPAPLEVMRAAAERARSGT